MIERQLKNLPKDQQELILKLVTENPELFKKINDEIQKEIKSGKEQTSAAMLVFSRHKSELQKLMANTK
jgi:hypothetical protein